MMRPRPADNGAVPLLSRQRRYCCGRTVSAVNVSLLLDGGLGALVGALITGSAQIWSFRAGLKSARGDLSLNAARDLLEVVHSSRVILQQLPYTESPAGSPLSYGERLDKARPMREALEHAQFAIVPLLTDREVARILKQFADYCEFISGPRVDAEHIRYAVDQVMRYGDHVRDCLDAHINKKPLPSPPSIEISGQR